jgi:hypothetical protein
MPASDAFQLAFGRSLDAVERDLRNYLESQPNSVILFSQRMDAVRNLEIGVAPTSDFEAALVMADLLAVMDKDDAAKIAFDSLNRQFTATEQIRSAPEERAASLAAMYFHLARIGWNPKQPTRCWLPWKESWTSRESSTPRPARFRQSPRSTTSLHSSPMRRRPRLRRLRTRCCRLYNCNPNISMRG